MLDGHFFETPTERIPSRSLPKVPMIPSALSSDTSVVLLRPSLVARIQDRSSESLRLPQFDSEVKFFAFPIRSANCIGRIQSAAGFARGAMQRAELGQRRRELRDGKGRAHAGSTSGRCRSAVCSAVGSRCASIGDALFVTFGAFNEEVRSLAERQSFTGPRLQSFQRAGVCIILEFDADVW